MGYRVLIGPDAAQYDVLKHSLVIDEVAAGRSSATFTAKHVDSLVGMMPVRISANTVSSVVFGGAVRGWTTQYRRTGQTLSHDIDVDDWRAYLDRYRSYNAYSSVAIDSIVRDLIGNGTGVFSPTGVHSLVNAATSRGWDRVTVSYDMTAPMPDLIDSLVAMQTGMNPDDPPVWRVRPDRTVHLVGATSSLGTTLVIDDADLALRQVEIQELATRGCDAVAVWGGYSQMLYQLNAAVTSIGVYAQERFWGPTGNWAVGGSNSLYVVTPAREWLPVLSDVSTATGIGILHISSIDAYGGLPHSQVNLPNTVQALVVVTAAAASMLVTSAVTGEPYTFSRGVYATSLGWGTNPIVFQPLAHSLLRAPGQELGMLRIWTTNTLAPDAGRVAVSLTAAGARRGEYAVRRIRVAGFDRGENAAPIYEIEAGALPRYRVDSLL